MDEKLVAWGRSVKSVSRWQVAPPPPLWLFTDPAVMADVVGAVACLPRGLCGVVFRHDGVADRVTLARAVARVCRQRRLVLVVADVRLARRLGVGAHLRGGLGWAGARFAGARFATASAHDGADLVRAGRAGARLAFLSPVFATRSHPGAAALGGLRWAALARRVPVAVAALGGIDGAAVRRLPRRRVRAIGAIRALVA